jgi:hypothetical protein
MQAFEATDGRMIDDLAHGSSAAHDPNNEKSVLGQRLAWDHLKQLALQGHAGIGALTEASDTDSLVDKNMPFREGIHNIREIHQIKMAGRLALAA